MGLFIQQKDNRSQLQERLAAELRERAKMQASGAEPIDQTKNSNYLKDTEVATSRSWLWFVVAVVVIAAIIALMLMAVR